MMKLTGSDSHILYAVMHVAVVLCALNKKGFTACCFPIIQNGFVPGWPWHFIMNTGLSLTQNLKCLVYSLYKCSHIHVHKTKSKGKSCSITTSLFKLTDQCNCDKQNNRSMAMRFASLYVFIALGAVHIISHTSAAPTSGLPASNKELAKHSVSSNKQADHEAETSETQADALTQMALAGIQLFFDGVNEVLAEEQQYDEGGYSDHGRDSFETSEDLAAYINGFTWNMAKLLPRFASGFAGFLG